MRVATLKLPPPPSLSTIVIKMIFNEAFLISLISSFSYLYTYFMRWKRCDGDIDSIEYRTTICGVHGLVFQSSGGSSYGQRKRQTHVMGDVLPTLARCFNKWYIVMHDMCFDDDFQFKTNKEKTAINTEIMRAFRVPRVRCDGCDGWWCGMHFVPSVPIPLCHMPQWQWHIPACFRVQYIWCGCWAACWMLLILKSLSKRMRQHIRAHRLKMMRSTKMVRIKFLALRLYCAQ